MVVEQKFKVLQKAEKEIYHNMNSNLRKIAYRRAILLVYGLLVVVLVFFMAALGILYEILLSFSLSF